MPYKTIGYCQSFFDDREKNLFKIPFSSIVMKKKYIHALFTTMFLLLGVAALITDKKDQQIDVVFFCILYTIIWWLCVKYEPPTKTMVLLVLFALPHLFGTFGLYTWSYACVSWDIFVHISTAFFGTLLMYSYLSTKQFSKVQLYSITIIAVALGGVVIELLEAKGGNVLQTIGGDSLTQKKEGFFYRGQGSFCSLTCPCTADVDTLKDLMNNTVGLLMGIVAILALEPKKARR